MDLVAHNGSISRQFVKVLRQNNDHDLKSPVTLTAQGWSARLINMMLLFDSLINKKEILTSILVALFPLRNNVMRLGIISYFGFLCSADEKSSKQSKISHTNTK